MIRIMKITLAFLLFACLTTAVSAQQTEPATATDTQTTPTTVKKDKLAKPVKDKSGNEVVKSKTGTPKANKGKGHAYGKHKEGMKGKEHGQGHVSKVHPKKAENSRVNNGTGNVQTDDASNKEIKAHQKVEKNANKKKGKKTTATDSEGSNQ